MASVHDIPSSQESRPAPLPPSTKRQTYLGKVKQVTDSSFASPHLAKHLSAIKKLLSEFKESATEEGREGALSRLQRTILTMKELPLSAKEEDLVQASLRDVSKSITTVVYRALEFSNASTSNFSKS